MLYIALGFLLLGLVVGGAGMRRAGRFARKSWRPGAGVLALAAFVGAAICAVREAFAPAVGLLALAVFLSLSTRRTASAPHVQPAAEPPEVAAAAAILGVSPDASEEEVQTAYLRLIRRIHPDQGGSAGLAAQLNAARDAMGRRKR